MEAEERKLGKWDRVRVMYNAAKDENQSLYRRFKPPHRVRKRAILSPPVTSMGTLNSFMNRMASPWPLRDMLKQPNRSWARESAPGWKSRGRQINPAGGGSGAKIVSPMPGMICPPAPGTYLLIRDLPIHILLTALHDDGPRLENLHDFPQNRLQGV